jgi:hypothetical protein
MEGLNQKLDRIAGDVNQLIELYDFAEKLYPYQNIREPLKVRACILYICYSSMKMSSAETWQPSLHMAMDSLTSTGLPSGAS